MKKLSLLISALVFTLAGCESMSVSECKVADWGRVGFADGSRGVAESRLAAYTEDCGKAGVHPNPVAYRQGWDAGILQFCTAANGWREGMQGNSGKAAVCQGRPGFEAFSRYLEAGLQVHRTSERMRENTNQINRLQKRHEESKSDEEKRRLRNELHDIDHEQYRLRGLMSQQQMLAP
jgi:hypothetical protein